MTPEEKLASDGATFRKEKERIRKAEYRQRKSEGRTPVDLKPLNLNRLVLLKQREIDS
jgi:hypothetical protein